MRKIKKWFETFYGKDSRYDEYPHNVIIAQLSFENLDLSQFAIVLTN